MSIVKTNNITGLTDSLPNNLKPITASAWVNFDGTGTVTIRDSYNVSSVTDIGVGQYNINFSSVLENEDYVVSASAGGISGPRFQMQNYFNSSVGMILTNTSEAPSDTAIINVTVCGGQ